MCVHTSRETMENAQSAVRPSHAKMCSTIYLRVMNTIINVSVMSGQRERIPLWIGRDMVLRPLNLSSCTVSSELTAPDRVAIDHSATRVFGASVDLSEGGDVRLCGGKAEEDMTCRHHDRRHQPVMEEIRSIFGSDCQRTI